MQWARTPKNIFRSTLRRDTGRKFVIPLDCISFGIQIPSVRHHSYGTIPFFQTCWRKTVSFLRTHGQFWYNLYSIPFMPRELPAWALWMKSRTSFSFILSSDITVGSWAFGKSLRGSIGILFKSSEYVILKFLLQYIKLATLWFHKKFFCKNIRICVEWSPSLTLVLSVFSLIFTWRSPKSFFEYHLGYSEVPSSRELGLLLISPSAFSVPILTLLSVSVSYSVIFLQFYLFYALLHQTTPDIYI